MLKMTLKHIRSLGGPPLPPIIQGPSTFPYIKMLPRYLTTKPLSVLRLGYNSTLLVWLHVQVTLGRVPIVSLSNLHVFLPQTVISYREMCSPQCHEKKLHLWKWLEGECVVRQSIYYAI